MRKKVDNRKSIYMPPESMEQVNAFPSRNPEFSTRVQEMIACLHHAMQRTEQEVDKLFSESEWNYLRDMLNSTLLTPDLPYRVVLPAQVEDANKYEGLGAKWNVNAQALADKLSNLPEFTCFVIAKQVEKWWQNVSNADKGE